MSVISWVLIVVLNKQVMYQETFGSFESCAEASHSQLIQLNNEKAYAECRKIIK
jgi:hypothetical protein